MDYIDAYLIDDGIRKKGILTCGALGCAITLFNMIFKPESLLVVILLYILAALFLLAGATVHIYIKNRNRLVEGVKMIQLPHVKKYTVVVDLYNILSERVDELNSKAEECNKIYIKLNAKIGWKAWKKIKYIDKFYLHYKPEWIYVKPTKWDIKYEILLSDILNVDGYLKRYSERVEYDIRRLEKIEDEIIKKDGSILALLNELELLIKYGNNIDYTLLKDVIEPEKYNKIISKSTEEINMLRKVISKAENALRKIL